MLLMATVFVTNTDESSSPDITGTGTGFNVSVPGRTVGQAGAIRTASVEADPYLPALELPDLRSPYFQEVLPVFRSGPNESIPVEFHNPGWRPRTATGEVSF